MISAEMKRRNLRTLPTVRGCKKVVIHWLQDNYRQTSAAAAWLDGFFWANPLDVVRSARVTCLLGLAGRLAGCGVH